MKKLRVPLFLFFAALILVLVISSRAMHYQSATSPALTQVSADTWEKLSQKRILFGHASVGYNILEGIETLKQTYPEVNLEVIHSATPWTVEQPGLTHFHWEDLDLWNEQPATPPLTLRKIDVFSTLMTTQIKGHVDMALMKFCWADINPETDVAQVFAHYKETMAKLMQQFPNTLFVQITTPLVAEPSGALAVKNWIKQLIGKPAFHLSDNVKINQLNDLIRAEYEGKAPIFDLAHVESTALDGKRQTFANNGASYFALVPDYTDDMGHLNAVGRQAVADHLLVFLADLVTRSAK